MFAFFEFLIARVFMPLPFCLLLGLLGLLLLLFSRRRRKVGAILALTGLILLYGFSSKVGAYFLLQPLESIYPSYKATETTPDTERIDYVVVLGSGHIHNERLPVTSRLNDTALVRLCEGIRVYRLHPGSKLVLSGGGRSGDVTNAEVMAKTAEALGVAQQDIVLESKSLTTFAEAEALAPLLSDSRFVMVTSASHMPRGMKLFKTIGLDPIPAPTRHYIRREYGGLPYKLSIPNSRYLKMSERAVYEYFGIAKAYLLDQI
jgi:uncharacterized SAM-binding protein YcdF (DUF218 family)